MSINSVIFLFLDGVGLGDEDANHNPLARAHLPFLRDLLDGKPLTANTGAVSTSVASLVPLDATLGVEGRPQSATGQAALLTGVNASAVVGEHYGPRPNSAIRDLVQAGTIFGDVQRVGGAPLFVNAYPPGYFAAVNRGKRVLSVMPLAAVSAGQALFTHDDLFAGRGFSADFTNLGWREHLGFPDAPLFTPEESGRNLAKLARQHRFVLFEHWVTDVQGHRQEMVPAVENLQQFDAFLRGVVEGSDLNDTLILVTSDHGNVEDLCTRMHTENAVPGLFIGATHKMAAASARSIVDIPTVISSALNLPVRARITS